VTTTYEVRYRLCLIREIRRGGLEVKLVAVPLASGSGTVCGEVANTNQGSDLLAQYWRRANGRRNLRQRVAKPFSLIRAARVDFDGPVDPCLPAAPLISMRWQRDALKKTFERGKT
jgi:hypothetical protein